MANLTQLPAPGSKNGRNTGFRPFNPALDGIVVAPHSDYGSKHAEAGTRRFRAAQDRLAKYGGSIEFTKNASGAIVLSLNLSFQTNHDNLDLRVHELVCGFGFSLSLESVPVKGEPEDCFEKIRYSLADGISGSYFAPRFIHTYRVSAGSNSNIDNADCVAEDLLKLASLMEPLMIREDRHGPYLHLAETPVPLLYVREPVRPRDSKQPSLVSEPAAAVIVGAKSPD